MTQNKKVRIQEEKGFTMIELIIVIAIMGILSAVLVPSFSNMTRKTRLKADVSTVQQLQTQIDVYVAERDGQFPGYDSTNDKFVDNTTKDIGSAVTALVKGEYIKASDAIEGTPAGTYTGIKLQTKNAKVTYDDTASVDHIVLDLTDTTNKVDTKVVTTAGNLSPNEILWIKK